MRPVKNGLRAALLATTGQIPLAIDRRQSAGAVEVLVGVAPATRHGFPRFPGSNMPTARNARHTRFHPSPGWP